MSDEAVAAVVGDVSAALCPYATDGGLVFPTEAHLVVAHE